MIDAFMHVADETAHGKLMPDDKLLWSIILEADIPGAVQEFGAKVATCAACHDQHLSLEESVVLPTASAGLATRSRRR